jgi:hypothetical protein
MRGLGERCYSGSGELHNRLRACLPCQLQLSFVFREGDEEPHLARFKGRSGEMSPKARFWMLAGCFLLDSSKFSLLYVCSMLTSVS